MQLHLQIIGFILIAISLLHFSFPKYFNWKEQLLPLSPINRQLMYIHSFFIAFVVFLLGLLCLSSGFELVNTELGKRICLGVGVFWLVRLVLQFFGYTSETWRGKKFETCVHIVFACLWFYFTTIFLSIYFL